MTQTLNVEYEELMARAAELDQPMPVPPPDNPQAPCALSFVVDAGTQVALSADALRVYLRACEREWRRLAQSLRNAAKAYEDVDEQAADSVTDNTSVAPVNPGAASGGDSNLLCDPDEDSTLPPPMASPPAVETPYYEVRQAATDIEAPDRGVAFSAFATDWDNYQRSLQSTAQRFRPFSRWEGQAVQAVELNFELHRTYVYQMAQLVSLLAAQAKTVATTHKWALTEHPTAYEVSEADKWFVIYSSNPLMRQYLWQVYESYERMQQKSEEVLATYVQRASLPLTPVNPKNPPTAVRIDPPPQPTKPDDDPSKPDDDPTNPDAGDPTDPDADDPTDPDADDLPDIPATPSTPSAGLPSTPPTGVPSLADNAALKDALDSLSSAPSAAAGMRPASVGGIGGGGGGIPSMPLAPALDAESAARGGGGGSVGRDLGNLARPGAGMGAGGMGMAPMGAPGTGAGQGGDSKAKRAQGTDESLYEEERPWTEGVIGNRRRKDVSDGKDSK